MRRLSRAVFVIMVVTGCAGHRAIAKDATRGPDFSGTWVLRTAVPNVPHANTQRVEQSPTEIKIQRITDQGGAGKAVNLRLTTDGEECANVIDGRPIRLRTAWKRGDLLITMRDPSAPDQYLEERWTLAPDRNNLTISLRVVAGDDVETARLVYSRDRGTE